MSQPPSKMIRSKSPSFELDKTYLATIVSLNDKIIKDSIRQDDSQSSLSLLTQLQNSIKSGDYGTYSSSKKHFYYHMFVCQYNMALVHQLQNNNILAKDKLLSAINNYQHIQGYITNRQENVAFIIELAKLLLQHCGLHSHCNQHQQATVLAEKSLDRLTQSARILQAICYEQVMLGSQGQTTCSSRQKVARNQMVNFKSLVIQQAQEMLQQLSKLPSSQRLLSQHKQYYLKIIKNVFNWQQNSENNQALLKKQLKIVAKQKKNQRNILGLQKQANNNQYEIGGIMMLNFKTIDYPQTFQPLRLISSHSLKQLAYCSSIAYFTIATQSRFSQADLAQIRGKMKICEKYQKLNHDQRLLKCKILHLKALEIAGKFLPANNALFGHLSQSFSRNYKFVMDQIHEVSEVTSMASIKQIQSQPKRLEKQQTSIFVQYGMRQQPRMSKKFSKCKEEKSLSRKKDKKLMASRSKKSLRASSQTKN